MKKILMFLFCITTLLVFTSCFQSKAISIVKDGHFTYYDEMTVGEAVDGFFGNPKWKSYVPADKELRDFMLVNVEGKIIYDDEKADAIIQFIVDEDTGEFELYAFEIDGVPQNDYMIVSLIEAMFE